MATTMKIFIKSLLDALFWETGFFIILIKKTMVICGNIFIKYAT